MTEKDDTSTAKDFRNQSVDLGGGIKITGKLRIAGMQYLEEKYDCGLDEIDFDASRMTTVVNLLVAMILGDYPEKSEKEVLLFVRGLDIEAISKTTGILGDVLNTNMRPAPNAPRRTTKKKVKKKKAKKKK